MQAALPAGSWQSYDIEFRAARFDEAGKREEPARVTVRHNGMYVHEQVEVREPTGGGSVEAAQGGPLRLQDHGQPVRFRRIWIERL
jgi:hypothetical protein